MDPSGPTLILAFGLGLLGFVEPCTIGAHMLFLQGQRTRSMDQRLRAVATFLLARLLVMGGFGGAIVLVGQRLIGVQTGAWLAFGIIYLAIGLAMVGQLDRFVRRRIRAAPERWRFASSAVLQGLAFGLSIPACAAPILFGLIAAATASGAAVGGFLAMAVFAVGLSLPLVPLSVAPRLAHGLDQLADWLRPRRWILGAAFAGLGLWSVWFGLFVDPQNWAF